MSFYTYLWLRDDGTPYYIGKGSGRRAFVRHDSIYPPRDRKFIVLLFRESETAAFETEQELIAVWGRKDLGQGCLRNRTFGGDGTCGKSAESRARIAVANQGNQHGIGNRSHTGILASAATREKMRLAHLGKPHHHRINASWSIDRSGWHHSDATRQKMREPR